LIDLPLIDYDDLPLNYPFLSDYKNSFMKNASKIIITPIQKEKNLYISNEMFKKYGLSVSEEFTKKYHKLFNVLDQGG